tara:strand:+ start:1239 stop:2798 length:1560 start_codon:yes stop_codon:yes gene_type:complete
MKLNILFKKETLFIILLFLFSLLINQYYGNKGIFPIDSFSHFDTGFRILLGEYPFKDYWVVSGPFVDYLQGLFFYLFGVNWQTYVFHASFINGIITIVTFTILRNFQFNIFFSFIYSLFFSILAYPSSGTPFVDHHSSFFALLGIYILLLAIKNGKNYYWILLPIIFGLSFLSKQVPALYIIFFTILILIFYCLVNRKYDFIKYILLGLSIFILAVLTLGTIQGINLSTFLNQYIFYPQTIGQNRFENLDLNFNNFVSHFKFIYLSLVPLVYLNLKNLFLKKNYFKEKEFINFLILILLTFSFILHQLLTKNQTIIFFLIPILVAFSHISLGSDKNIISVILIVFCLLITIKYHLRFNEDRKFHELNNSNFKLSVDGNQINQKLKGLNWITPEFKKNPQKEINLINETKIYLKNENRFKMILTNYSFFSVILNESSFSTTRWHAFDGTDYPKKGNKYFEKYKSLLINSIKSNKIEVIYTIKPVKRENLYDYIDENCFNEKKLTEILTMYELKNCKEIDY